LELHHLPNSSPQRARTFVQRRRKPGRNAHGRDLERHACYHPLVGRDPGKPPEQRWVGQCSNGFAAIYGRQNGIAAPQLTPRSIASLTRPRANSTSFPSTLTYVRHAFISALPNMID